MMPAVSYDQYKNLRRALWLSALFLVAVGVSGAVVALQSWPDVRQNRLAGGTSHPDVFIVLAGDSERAGYARVLLAQDPAARILSTLVDTRCAPLGDPDRACATGVRNTVDEALLMRRTLSQEQVRSATIITSRYHAPRAGGIFRIMFIGSGIQLQVVTPPGVASVPASLRVQEMLKFLPCIGAALLARLTPDLYERLMQFEYGA